MNKDNDKARKCRRLMGLMRLAILMGLMMPLELMAQDDPKPIIVKGNVYGGGNKGKVDGNTTVTVVSGDLNKVFGGARMANVGGRSFVNIDGEKTTEYIMANQVYGGNDIAGTIGEGNITTDVPSELEAVKNGSDEDAANPKKNAITSEWKTFVHVSGDNVPITEADLEEKKSTKHAVYIGSLFAGGNGDYTHRTPHQDGDTQDTYRVYDKSVTDFANASPIAESETDFTPPALKRTYLEINGGSIVYAFGGGNNATVTEKTVIHVDNPTDVVASIQDPHNPNGDENDDYELLTSERILKMGINPGLTHPNSAAFQIGSLFGGNNAAEMAIRPTWNLQSGLIRNVYSGGNKGAMTNLEGLLLEIDPASSNTNPLKIDNVYGGCRMADVHPLKSGTLNGNHENATLNDIQLSEKNSNNQPKYAFPTGLSARTLVRGGDINNVYGGNDITGHVVGGNAVGIYTTIRGNVYGGGNGAYPYTDNPALKNDPTYGDLYYNPTTVLTEAGISAPSGQESVTALNRIRPDAEQVSIRLVGKYERDENGEVIESSIVPTIIHGSVYIGGNCATIKNTNPEIEDPMAQLKIGSYVIAENIFMGNNGENMVNRDYLKHYYASVKKDTKEVDLAVTVDDQTHFDYSQIDLTSEAQMKLYMDGVSMSLKPSTGKGITLDDGYIPYSSQIGSLFCGGNVGSMTYEGTQTMNFLVKGTVYNKIVGGCNNANVPELWASQEGMENPVKLNAVYEGGVLGATNERGESTNEYYTDDLTATGNIKDRLVLNFEGVRIEPKRWKMKKDDYGNVLIDDDGNEVYDPDDYGNHQLEWNTAKQDENHQTWKYVAIQDGLKLAAGEEYYIYSDDTYSKQTAPAGGIIAENFFWKEEDYKQIDTEDEADDQVRRLIGGNIYGGCYNSGHVNGNVVININDDIITRYGDETYGLEGLFATSDEVTDPDTGKKEYQITDERRTGVILENQRDDLDIISMSLFGAGKGLDTEVWGSTTVNLNKGYMFQVFGGGEEGVVGKSIDSSNEDDGTYDETTGNYTTNNKLYTYNPAYTSRVFLKGQYPGYSEEETGNQLAETEYIYGGGNEGDVCGDSKVYLGNGRIYDAFGGASDADILGHTEVYIGYDSESKDVLKFPWVRDVVYGGNDFGGIIHGTADFTSRVSDFAKPKVHGWEGDLATGTSDVLTASAYVEYREGRVDTIFGGGYGNYDYNEEYEGYTPPYLSSAFVNFSPAKNNSSNFVNAVFGAGTGYPGYYEGDKSQDRSYVLIDIPKFKNEEQKDVEMENFWKMDIFGAGSYDGLGMREEEDGDGNLVSPVLPVAEAPEADVAEKPAELGENPTTEQEAAYQTQLAAYNAYKAYTDYTAYQENLPKFSAIVDLIRGKVGTAYGGSYNEGITRRSVVNVPKESTINIGGIFGGAFGNVTLDPCDVYEANVEYHSEDAVLRYNPWRIETNDGKETLLGFDPEAKDPVVTNGQIKGNKIDKGAIYGGNNHRRRTLYAKINIDVPVRTAHHKYGSSTAYVYGAGCGENTWAEYTEVNLKRGAQVWEVYGGGQDGLIINAEGIQKYITGFASVQGLGSPKKDDETDEKYGERIRHELQQWKVGWTLGSGYDGAGINDAFTAFNTSSDFYVKNTYTNLNNPLVTPRAEFGGKRFNTNVIINEGAYVGNYAYGGGLGHNDRDQSGNVYGTTYIALLGGEVKKDIYAAGSTGGVLDAFGVGAYDENTNPYGFTAGTTAYVGGGTCRNVYGGGWEGNVGLKATAIKDEIPGETNVVIGIRSESLSAKGNLSDNEYTRYLFHHGVPAIQRNAYAGGEGGSIIGTANITVNNGYIGYLYLLDNQEQNEKGETVTLAATPEGAKDRYDAKIHDDTYKVGNEWKGTNRLVECGNVYGSGYDDLSSVDISNVTLYGGTIRNSVFGGGEIATIGRGSNDNNDNKVSIFKAGETHIYMYNGHVMRNVFGAGKGYNTLGYGGAHNLHTDGYVFGTTEVNIYGGEIGTNEGITVGDGNVFGGGDRGYVFSAFEYKDGNDVLTTGHGVKKGVRYDHDKEGYYYKSNDLSHMTEDCKVLIEPWLQVKKVGGIEYGGKTYAKGEYIPTDYLNTLPKKILSGTLTSQWPDKWDEVDVGELVDKVDENGNIVLDKQNQPEKVFKERGVIIHNAVFAGGNVSSNSSMNANTNTVFGNATASIRDVYHRDLITIGMGHTGGLYGDGNLTLVDGYRELNITNYGTDYYHLKDDQITIDQYYELPGREQDYYELRYKFTGGENGLVTSIQDKKNTTYTIGSTLRQDDLIELFEGIMVGNEKIILDNGTPNPKYWVENGIVSRYSGRILNTIQRADFCGVFGSRLVLQGAQDRVPEVLDYNNYTINRVREVSLNKITSSIDADYAQYTQEEADADTEHKITAGAYKDPNAPLHGNYFGIYNVVNYLGALTSDVNFGDESANTQGTDGKWKYDIRTSDHSETAIYQAAIEGLTNGGYGEQEYTFYNWKRKHHTEKTRNNGNSHNQVALASGVYLEITTEESTGPSFEEKVWGPITGVVELDLINVSTGTGGGFVYAKNEHGIRSESSTSNRNTLTAMNLNAVSYKDFSYDETENTKKEWQTSGNFVHSTQTIIDDCYNIGGKYKGEDAVAGHYWFIKGQIYVYDQIISAYTGAPNAFSETVDMPLTITAASRGKMTLIDVQPNLYAYYKEGTTKLGADEKIVIRDVAYQLNDPISYWDWQQLRDADKALFVPETYYVLEDCKIGNTSYTAGTVMLKNEYDALITNNVKPEVTQEKKVGEETQTVKVDFDYVFRPTNNLGHDTGYILTYSMTNPSTWDKWYSEKYGDASKQSTKQYNELTKAQQDAYWDGPTYRLKDGTAAVLAGQTSYKLADIITQADFDAYEADEQDTDNDGELDENEDKNGNGVRDIGIAKKYPDAIPTDDPNAQGYDKDKVQAKFERAYLTTQYVETKKKNPNYTQGGTEPEEVDIHLQEGAKLAASEYKDGTWSSLSGKVAEAFVCNKSFDYIGGNIITVGQLMTRADINHLASDVNTSIADLAREKIANLTTDQYNEIKEHGALTNAESWATLQEGLGTDGKITLNSLTTMQSNISANFVPAYYCTREGLYGGDYYESGYNYRGLAAWSAMSDGDRDKFTFNYDALDLFIDKTYGGNLSQKYQYDGTTDRTNDDDNVITAADVTNPPQYSLPTAVDYSATYEGPDMEEAEKHLSTEVTVTRIVNNESTLVQNVDQLKPGDILDREEFEKLFNEQYHYAPISVTSTDIDKTFYIVNTAFTHNEPYAVGQIIEKSTYDNLDGDAATESASATGEKANVTLLTFSEAGTYYYCRDAYTIDGTHGQPVQAAVGNTKCFAKDGTPLTVAAGETRETETDVPVGFVIKQQNTSSDFTKCYRGLLNEQTNFTIHGIAPVETSTLYVSKNSDIFDLAQDKIITVIYQYDYEESDQSGLNITPVSERHVVNIRIKFKSGIPTIGAIEAPDIVLPGTSVILTAPEITQGAYQVFGTGWELFATEAEAESHINGIEYTPSTDRLYWYQDGYLVAYYAKTYLGKTYSQNHVPVSVANYHDLFEVMEDKTHHMYVDNKNVKRDSKIYIHNHDDSPKDGAELLKDFFDLSLLTGNGDVTVSQETGLITGDTRFNDHALLNSHVKEGKHLDFILHSNISRSTMETDNPEHATNPEAPEKITVPKPWTPIAGEKNPETHKYINCFEGTLHGDGYTISGLSESLFGQLCGDVYNLGVTGTFIGAGIAEEGEGYVENCWISTTSTKAKTSKPIFGNPSRIEGEKVQVVNSYYMEEDDAATTAASDDVNKMVAYNNPVDDDHGTPTRKPAKAFYNGEVAYDLNSFYLNKRYYDQQTLDENERTPEPYKYLERDADGKLKKDPADGYYPKDRSTYVKYSDLGYVERRYADGDFRYSEGVIPTSAEPRERIIETEKQTTDPTTTITTQETIYAPIWPDDYLFFGQNLTYGYDEDRPHQDEPSHFLGENRVYRAPAYFRNRTMSVAHFNPDAVLAAKEKLTDEQIAANKTPREAYPGMTAIDFAGHQEGHAASTYKQGLNNGWFFSPLLDDDGLTSIMNADETRNLLVYAPAGSGDGYTNAKTLGELTSYFIDPSYEVNSDANEDNDTRKFEDTKKYGRVKAIPESSIHGHIVQNDFTATTDHLLVDKNDFNAPFGYQFAEDKRMWYQRTPDNYANLNTGWEGISIPFEAEIVTTNEKGEITHFYKEDATTPFSKKYDTGHEYWLRKFEDLGLTATTDAQTNETTLAATFKAPVKMSAVTKKDGNAFLWDYYYSYNQSKDQNEDVYKSYDDEDYKKTEYYKTSRSYPGYPRLTKAIPYIIGFPGEQYYEFDLSGQFHPTTAHAEVPSRLDQQTISFVSTPGISIGVSDEETTGATAGVTKNTTIDGNKYDFTFWPSYLNNPDVEGAVSAFPLNAAGSSFDETTGTTSASLAFRPYFTGNVTAVEGTPAPRRIIIVGDNNTSLQPDIDEHHSGFTDGGLIISVDKRDIVVESTRRDNATVRITMTTGVGVSTFTIEPGQIIRTQVNMTGVYIVNRNKVIVK